MVEVTTSGQTPAGATQTNNTATSSAVSNETNGFPYPNVLGEYASYSCIITLGILDDNELADPNGTYRRNGVKRIIARSGGSGNQQVKTYYEQQLGITAEYFIDDLEVNSIVVPNTASRQTNATTVSFTINEPYSMGLLLETLAESVRQVGNSKTVSYTSVPFILSVEFIGYDDNGEITTIPNTARYIPIRLTELEFNVSGAGSEYSISGIAWNDQVFLDEIQRITSDIQMQGTTVADFLQLSEGNKSSLTSVLNNTEQVKKDKENSIQPNQFVIAFPTDSAAFTQALLAESEDSEGATQTDQSQSNGSPEVSQNSISLETLERVVSQDVNAIGKSSLAKNLFDSGTQLFGRPDPEEEENENGDTIFKRAGITVSPKERSITARTGKRIQDIIEEIVLMSEYAAKFVNDEPDENGLRNYFKIEGNVYNITDEEHIKKTGSSAKIYVYKVVPYKVSQTHFNAPTQNTPNISELRKKIPKEYNYIYSGLNDDIIDFDIRFNTAFYEALRYDIGALTADQIDSFGFDPDKEDPLKTAEGQSQDEAIPGTSNGGPTNGSSTATGDIAQTSKMALARTFNDILLNSVADLITADLEIWGDPYFLTDTGVGNYTAKKDGLQQTVDKTMDYQGNEPYIILNFITPIDYNQTSNETDYGSMQFPKLDGEPVKQFSGVYRVNTLTNTISGNKFTQQLNLMRLRNQTNDDGENNLVEPGDAINSYTNLSQKAIDAGPFPSQPLPPQTTPEAETGISGADTTPLANEPDAPADTPDLGGGAIGGPIAP